MASALLAVFNPENYAVIDRYAWRTYATLSLGKPSLKTSFSPADYGRFVTFCRTRRESLPGWTTRDIEKVLFLWGEQRD